MANRIPHETADPASTLQSMVPIRPRRLERLAALCMKAGGQDSRLGDLAEQYVRTRERSGACLGPAPWAMRLAELAADTRYLWSAANVVLFARAVEPALRLAEPGAWQATVLDIKERIMATLHALAGKLVLPALLIVGSAILANTAMNVWSTWRDTEALLVGLQREKAHAAATQIAQYLATVQDQIEWAGRGPAGGASQDQRRYEYLRLLRQVPAIVEIAHLDSDGKELVRVSRSARDTRDSMADFSGDVRFTRAVKDKKFVGPVYFDKRSVPHVSVAIAQGAPGSGVTLAEVDVRRLWEVIDTVKVGETGYAYVVDDNGRLIASRDKVAVLRESDLSALPQVRAVSARARSARFGEGVAFETSLSGAAVLSVHSAVPVAGWTVFVELPDAEARAPLWNALARAAFLVALALLAIVLAGFAATRRDMRAASASS